MSFMVSRQETNSALKQQLMALEKAVIGNEDEFYVEVSQQKLPSEGNLANYHLKPDDVFELKRKQDMGKIKVSSLVPCCQSVKDCCL